MDLLIWGMYFVGLLEWGLLGDFLDHGVRGNFDVLGEGFVQGLVELGENVRGGHAPVEDGTGGVGGGVRAGDQLGEGLGGQFGAFKLVTVSVLALHKAGKQIHTGVVGHNLRLETLVDTGNGDTGKVLNGLQTFGEEAVRDVLGEGDERGHAAQGSGHLSTTVQNFDSGDILGRVLGVQTHLGNILALLEHAEGSSESQVADDIERQVVEPVEGVDAYIASLGVTLKVGQTVPLLHELLNVAVDILLKLANGLGTESVGNGLALAGVLDAVTGVEQATADRDKGIVEVPGILLVSVQLFWAAALTYAFKKPLPCP